MIPDHIKKKIDENEYSMIDKLLYGGFGYGKFCIPDELPNVIIAIVINSLFVYIILKSSNTIEKILGKNGIGIIRRVFGIILLSISVKLFSTNISLIV